MLGRSAPQQLHHLRAIPVADDLGNRGADPGEVLIGERDVDGADVLLKPGAALGAGDRDDVLALGEHPRERELRRACAVHQITALQTEYSLWSLDPEDAILPTCRELGIGFVAYSPLGRGFLTGAIKSVDDLDENDFRRTNPRFVGANFERNLELVRTVEELAQSKGVTPAQLALAWVLAQGEDIVPIPGTKHVRYLEENAGALDVALTDEDLARLEEAAPVGVAAGDRYADMSSIDR